MSALMGLCSKRCMHAMRARLHSSCLPWQRAKKGCVFLSLDLLVLLVGYTPARLIFCFYISHFLPSRLDARLFPSLSPSKFFLFMFSIFHLVLFGLLWYGCDGRQQHHGRWKGGATNLMGTTIFSLSLSSFELFVGGGEYLGVPGRVLSCFTGMICIHFFVLEDERRVERADCVLAYLLES